MEPVATTSDFSIHMSGDPFVILIEGIDPQVAAYVRDFREVKTIANITLSKYRAQVRDIWERDYTDQIDKSRFGVPKELKALLRNERPKPKSRVKSPKTLLKTKRENSETPPVRRRSLLLIKTSTPLTNRHRIIPKTVELTRRKKQQEIARIAKKRKSASQKIIREVCPKDDKMLDLIPPDVDALDLEMDKLFLANPETDGSDTFDSVSCMSVSSQFTD